jgi:DNA-binding NarL/FixJ family response regulator
MNTLLVDDHALFREGLAMLIEHRFPAMRLQQAGTLAEALDAVTRGDGVKLVLLDLSLPDSHGTAGLARLRDAAPEATVVVLSADDSPATVLAAIDGGAAGFIPKTASAAALQAALQVVMAGGVSLPAGVLQAVHVSSSTPSGFDLADGSADIDGDALTGLSPRQLDVLRLLIEGRPNKLICRELDLSESTVKTHLAAIFRKLDVNSRTQAVVAAAHLGLRFRAFSG